MMAMNFKFRIPNFLRSVGYVLAAVNGVFLITGLVLLYVGKAVLVRYTEYDVMITNRFFNLAGLLIATAVIIILGSAPGFYGAISRHVYVIGAYLILLFVVLVLEISIFIVGFSLGNETVQEIRTPMAQSLQFYGSSVEISVLWEHIQIHFACCGVDGRFDWVSSQIPVSCCYRLGYGTISGFECRTANAYSLGCAAALGGYLAHQAYMVAITATFVTCIQVILVSLVSLAAYLTWREKHEEDQINFFESEIRPPTEPPVWKISACSESKIVKFSIYDYIIMKLSTIIK